MSVFQQNVVIASGVSLPLMAVSGCLGQLDSYLRDAATHHIVFNLRRLSLGNKIPEDSVRELTEHGLVESDGSVRNTMKEVVLASVRGESHNLFIASPFIVEQDRLFHEFLSGREYIRSVLPEQQAEKVIAERDPLPAALREFSKTPGYRIWVDQSAEKDGKQEKEKS